MDIGERRYSDAFPEGEAIGIIAYGNLSPIEHFMIGGTPEVRGELLDAREMIEAAKNDDEVRKLLLTPIDLLEGKKDLGVVIEGRQAMASSRMLSGLFAILSDGQVDLQRQGVGVSIAPSPFISGVEHFAAEWELQPFEGRSGKAIDYTTHPDVFGRLQLRESYVAIFGLTDNPAGNSKVLHLRGEIV